MIFKYFYVPLSVTKTADLLSEHVSPQLYYHHNRQGGTDWTVELASKHDGTNRTRITLHENVDDSVITYLLLKSS